MSILGPARTQTAFYSLAADGLRNNPRDIPFCAFFSVEVARNSSHAHSILGITSRASFGVPEGHGAAQGGVISVSCDVAGKYIFNSQGENDGNLISAWPFGDAAQTRQPYFIPDIGGLSVGLESRGWEDVGPSSATVVPFFVQDSQYPSGFMVMGCNPRLPFDESYRSFIDLLQRQISATLGTVLNEETEIERSAKQTPNAKYRLILLRIFFLQTCSH